MEQLIRRRRGLSLYLVFAFAMVALIFTEVISPRMRRKRMILPREKRVTLALNPEVYRKNYPRLVTPVKTRADRQSRLKRYTQYISEKENAFSGRTTPRKTRRWVRPDKNPVSGKTVQRSGKKAGSSVRDPGKAPKIVKKDKGTKVSGDSLASFDGRLTDEQRRIFRETLSTFQELPGFRNLNTELLINFSNDGTISLGTYAYRHSAYFYGMVRKISKMWYQYFPKFQHFYGLLKEGNVLVLFELDLDGTVTKVKLAKSYGQHSLDRACIAAVREARNFGPIPSEFREKGKMKIPFLFVYKRPKRPLKMFR